MVLILLTTIHVCVSLFLIAVVLLQQGKGADLSVFGGGGTMTAFGARGAATLLHKLTVISFIVFIVTTVAIGLLQERRTSGSVMSGLDSPDEGAVTATTDDAGTDGDGATDAGASDAPATGGEATGDAAQTAPATDTATEGDQTATDTGDGAAPSSEENPGG